MSNLEPLKPKTLAKRTPAQSDALMLDQARDIATGWGEVEKQALERMAEELPALAGRDIPGAVRNIATARAIAVDKANLLSGRPTEIVEHVDARDIIRDIRKIVAPYMDSTADEIQ